MPLSDSSRGYFLTEIFRCCRSGGQKEAVVTLHCLKDSNTGVQGRREEHCVGMEGMLQCEGLRTLDESGVQVKSYQIDLVCYSSYKKSCLYLLIYYK